MDRKLLSIAFGIVILNILLDHFLAPTGIFLTPLCLIVTTTIIAFGIKNLKSTWRSILTYGLVALNDIGIKLFGGGSHDMPGQAWIHLFLFIGLFPSFLILLIAIIKNKQESIFNRILAILVFSALTGTHLYLFQPWSRKILLTRG